MKENVLVTIVLSAMISRRGSVKAARAKTLLGGLIRAEAIAHALALLKVGVHHLVVRKTE